MPFLRSRLVAAVLLPAFWVAELCLPMVALAATRTWDGGGSTNNWSEDANWSDNTAPTAADTALFDGTDATDAAVDADILVSAITVTSGYGGTLSLGSSTITGSVGDGAVQFTAADKSKLQIADASQTGLDPGTSDFSISGWFYFDSLVNYEDLITKGGYYVYTQANGMLVLAFDDGTGGITGNSVSSTVTTGTWYFISINFDRDGNAVLSVNNVAKITLDISGKQGDMNNAYVFILGGYHTSGYDEYFNGRLDSLSFSSRLLTADEITWLYNSGNGRVYKDIGIAGTDGSDLKTSLVSWWDLGENAGTRYDAHGTNHLSQTFGNIIAPPVYGSEKLTNTGFETAGAGDPDFFGTWDDSAGNGAIADETVDIHGGSHAVKLTAGSSVNTYLGQTVAVTASTNMRLSFWTHGDGTYAGQYRISNLSLGGDIVTSISTGVTGAAYTLVTVDFAVPASTTSIYIRVYCPSTNTGIAYFDDVSLKQITTASINNGGFEDWTTSTNAGTWSESVSGTSTVNREDTAPYNGTNAARLDIDASGNLARFYQTVLTSGKLYTSSIYAKATSGTPNIRTWFGNSSADQAITTSYAAYTRTARADATNFLIGSTATSNSIYIDSVTLTAAEILGTTGIPRGRGPAVDYAGQFNGTSQSLSYTGTSFNPGTGDFSVVASFYLDRISGSQYLFSLGTESAAADFIEAIVTANGYVSLGFNDSTASPVYSIGTTLLTVGNWYTLILKFDRDGNMTGKINNVSDGGLTASISAKATSVDSGNLWLGRYSFSAGSYFGGRFQGVGYINRLTTDAEDTYLHNNGKWRMFSELGLAGTNGSALTSSVVKGFYDMDTAGALGADSTTNGNTLTNNGTVTQGTGNSQYTGGASFTFDQPGTLNLSSATVRVTDGTFDVDDAGAITAGSSTVELNGISNLSGSTLQSLHSVKVLTGAIVTQRSATTLDGTFTNSGSYAISTGTLSVGGSLYLPGTFTHGNGTVTLTGAGSEAIDTGGNSLYTLTLNGGGVYDLLDTLTITSALTLAGSSILDLNGQTLVVTGASFSNDGTLRLKGNETVTGITNDSNSGTVEYDGTSGPYTLKDWPYYGLTLSGNGATVALSSDAAVSNALTVGTGATLSLGSSTLTATNAEIVNYGTTNEGTGKIVHTHGALLLADAAYVQENDYPAGDTTYLTVTDADENISGAAQDSLTVTMTLGAGDTETATLTETTKTSGVFRGSVPTVIQENTTFIVADNGVLETPSSTTITLAYADAQDAGDTGSDTANLTIGSSVTAESTEVGGGGGGSRGSPAQMAERIAQAREAILARFEGKKAASEQIAAQENQEAGGLSAKTQKAKAEELAAQERETRIAERIAGHEAAIALIQQEKEELQKKYALRRDERYARALALEEQRLAEKQVALEAEQTALAEERKTNAVHREERLAKRSRLTEEEELARREAEEREELAAREREERIAQRIAEYEAEVARSGEEQEELEWKYALRRDERYARALKLEQEHAAAAGAALLAEQQALKEEQEANTRREAERIAQREARDQEALNASAPSSLSPDLQVIAARRGKLFATVEDVPVMYADVSLDEWYAPYVSYVIEENIATGYEDETGKPKGEFGVGNPITYAEVLKMAMQSSDQTFDLRGLPPPRNTSAKGTWAAAYLAQAEALSLSVFAPSRDVNKPATRGAVIQTLLEVLGIPTGAKAPSPFEDLPNNHPYAPAIVVATTYGLVSGDLDASGNPLNTFRPDDPINRAEVAKIIALIKELLQ